MSLTTCHDCGAYIDTDSDTECWIEVGNFKRLMDVIAVCPPCREEREECDRAPDRYGEEDCMDSIWFDRAGSLS